MPVPPCPPVLSPTLASNTDRFPLGSLFKHGGNRGNILWDHATRTIGLIDQAVSPIGDARLRKVLKMVYCLIAVSLHFFLLLLPFLFGISFRSTLPKLKLLCTR